jgi:hypothetical protein
MDLGSPMGPLGDPPGNQTKEELIIRLMQENAELRLEADRLRKAADAQKPAPIPPSSMHSLNSLASCGATPEIRIEAVSAIVRLLRTYGG